MYHRRVLLLLLLFYSIHALCANRSSPPAENETNSATSSIPQTDSMSTNRQQAKAINKLKSIKTDCTKDLFHIQLDLGKPFKGIVFAKEFSDDCQVKGDLNTTVDITLPASSCGVRITPRPNDMMQMAVKLIIQMDKKLRQQVDMEKNIRCVLPSTMMDVEMDGMMAHITEKKRNGRMRQEVGLNEPRVRVWLELGASDGAEEVEVGEPTTMGIRALLPKNIGVRVVDCSAVDGLGESNQKLLDERGCPVDEQVMPALLMRERVAEEGWSKPTEDELVEKLFTTTFPAFKFPDRERLHVQCSIQLCNGKCPMVDCKENTTFNLPTDKHLARIEVFNSLAVSAPQIEIDRLPRDKQYEDEVRARRQRSEGVLCLSSSNLAMSFAILGLIILAAVIVAIICMIKARMAEKQAADQNTSVFSSSSSSQGSTNHSRSFGAKLLIPYGSGSLPYGRVY